MLKLVEFIKNNKDWETKLQDKPYSITIKRQDNFIMFSYSQIDSDFYNPIVKECRGTILEDITFNPVCVPFFKFGNYGEGYVDTIDWSSARVQEKVDGSLIKVWNFNSEWKISTNGMINAKDANLPSDISEYRTYYDLFIKAAENSGLDFNKLDSINTYMFELISPFNRVVVPYAKIEIRHIGTRNIKTLEEIDIDIGITKPKQYNFHSLVVVDKYWRRNKVKSPAYVAVHHLKNNGIVTKDRIVELIRQNEQEELLTYYPEFTEAVNNISNKINVFINDMNWCIETAKENKTLDNRKRFAEFAKTTKCPALLFNWLDGKISNAKEWLFQQTNEKIVIWIGEKV